LTEARAVAVQERHRADKALGVGPGGVRNFVAGVFVRLRPLPCQQDRAHGPGGSAAVSVVVVESGI